MVGHEARSEALSASSLGPCCSTIRVAEQGATEGGSDGINSCLALLRRRVGRAHVAVALLMFTFLLKVLGWAHPGISGGPTWTPPPCITCGTVHLFFDCLLHLIIFVFARFSGVFLTFQLLPANWVFLPTRL